MSLTKIDEPPAGGTGCIEKQLRKAVHYGGKPGKVFPVWLDWKERIVTAIL